MEYNDSISTAGDDVNIIVVPEKIYCGFCESEATHYIKNTSTPICDHCKTVYECGQASPDSEIISLEEKDE